MFNNLIDIIRDIDLVCLMSVNPGFGGQSFIENTFEKVKQLKKLIKDNQSSSLIEIDGGVTNENGSELISNGADVLVAGSYVFSAKNPKLNIDLLRENSYCFVLNCTLRLIALPLGLSLSPMGFTTPNPITSRRSAGTPSFIKYSSTALARFSESSSL